MQQRGESKIAVENGASKNYRISLNNSLILQNVTFQLLQCISDKQKAIYYFH
jgi:hypothetical protein